MKVYISGPITGHDNFNRGAFSRAEIYLKSLGHEVVNPTIEVLPCDGWGWEDYMKADLKLMMDCDALYMLPGWEESKGASLEQAIAWALQYELIPTADI